MDKLIAIDKLSPKDTARFQELIHLFEVVFEMEDFKIPDEAHLRNLLQKPDFFVFVASTETKIVGGLTVYVLEQYYATQPLAYIYDLAVDESFQRQGIGSKLIQTVKEFCKQRGFEEVFVQADKIDAYDLDFYRTTQPTAEEQVVHFYYKLS